MEHITIREAGINDAELLARVGRESFYAAFAGQNTSEDMEKYLSASFSGQIQAAEIMEEGSTFLLAENGGLSVGYARLFTGGQVPTCITGRSVIELVRFYLLPQWVGKGAAGTLMQACLDKALGGGYDEVWLGVWQENPRAIRFYQKWGFAIAGTHSFQLGAAAQTDWIMSRPLQQGSA